MNNKITLSIQVDQKDQEIVKVLIENILTKNKYQFDISTTEINKAIAEVKEHSVEIKEVADEVVSNVKQDIVEVKTTIKGRFIKIKTYCISKLKSLKQRLITTWQTLTK